MADSFEENIRGVENLVDSNVNKVMSNSSKEEGVESPYVDVLDLKMTEQELLNLKDQWIAKDKTYSPEINKRQEINKTYYLGKQVITGLQSQKGVASNYIFEAEETFIPQALSKNPEPVVWSDNTEEGKEASNMIKAMLQHKADTMGLRQKLGTMVRHWSIYFLGVVKHGWSKEYNDITTDIRKPKNFILDPDGYIDEFGNYCGEFLGERIATTGAKMIELFPDKKDYIVIRTNGKLSSATTYTEWWTDKYCFSTFEDIVLDKHKNEFFNYDIEEQNSLDDQIKYGIEEKTVTPGKNHFASPRMPYTFLSVFSLQEQPHDITTLIEQSIPNQDRIVERDLQITKNLRTGNNSLAVSGQSFTAETARQAAQAIEDGDPILVPDGRVNDAIQRLPASALPSGILESQQIDKDTLRSVFGTLGLSASKPNSQTTARGQILNTEHDSTRIGGGMGDKLEQVADNIFNWWLQLFYVFYDEPHYGAIIGSGRAVEYVQLINSNMNRQFVVSVSPNSMQPKDEITEQNLAIDLANKGWLDPLNLFKKLNYADPMETAKMVTLYKLDPMSYYQQYFGQPMPMPGSPDAGNPADLEQPQAPVDQSLSADKSSSDLSQVPINTPAMPA
jgi:hypothetical protein